MRHSMTSLLEVYLGIGPASRVVNGDFQRGTDDRRSKPPSWSPTCAASPTCRNGSSPTRCSTGWAAYFEVVVDAVRAEGGDVLKFIGDGVLSVFPPRDAERKDACLRAARSVARAFADNSHRRTCRFVAALHVGPVVYGNIGSLDRLDLHRRRPDGQLCQPTRRRRQAARQAASVL